METSFKMISRTECAPRKIKIKKKQGEKEDSKSDNEQIYQFYRYYIHPCILRLKNDKGTYCGETIFIINSLYIQLHRFL